MFFFYLPTMNTIGISEIAFLDSRKNMTILTRSDEAFKKKADIYAYIGLCLNVKVIKGVFAVSESCTRLVSFWLHFLARHT